MTTIILSVLGILLAAAAALMVVFYGGNAFNDGSVGAAANTLQNAGNNVSSGAAMYRMTTGGLPANLAALTANGGEYLSEEPSIEGVGTNATITAAGANSYYDVTGVTQEVCAKVNENMDNAFDADSDTVPTARGTGKMGCYGSGTAFTFFAKL